MTSPSLGTADSDSQPGADAGALARRRRQLAARLPGQPLVIAAGVAPARNYAANTYDFRASSHFLYLTGLQLAGAQLLLVPGAGGEPERAELFVPPPAADDALWHGEVPSFAELQQRAGVDAVRPLPELAPRLASLGPCAHLPLPHAPAAPDEQLAHAMIEQRLRHDEAAVRELRRAVAVTVEAHRAGMRATRPGVRVAAVRAAMEQPIHAADFTAAYPSIVTTHGEILHTHDRSGVCHAGELLLADVGAESDSGWASDVTRTWPVSGTFSASQRAIYDIVLSAQVAAIAAVRPGVRYRDVHLTACRVLCAGLIEEGLLSGEVDGLVERGAHALFFPHGIGHLIGMGAGTQANEYGVHGVAACLRCLDGRQQTRHARPVECRVGSSALAVLHNGVVVLEELGFLRILQGDEHHGVAAGGDHAARQADNGVAVAANA